MSDDSLALARSVSAVLDRSGIRYTLIGAAALSVFGYTRATEDIDFLTTDLTALSVDWSGVLPPSAVAECRKGDFDDPLGGVITFTEGDASVDLVIGKWKWQQRVIDDSETRELEPGFVIRVARAEDLLLMKIDAGGFVDLRDAEQLLALRPDLEPAVEARVNDLPLSLQEAWRRFTAQRRRE